MAAAELVSLADIGEACGVSTQAAWNWVTRYADFPAHVTVRRGARLWDAAEVRAWAAGHGREWKEPANERTPR